MTEVSGSDHHARLTALVRRAVAEADASGRAVLVSVVEPAPAIDPLAALAAAAALTGERMFWARPAQGTALAALGAAVFFAPTGPERFAEADAAWRGLLEHALVDDADGASRTTGPLLVGGFSFAPDGPRSALWRGFGSTHLVVPALLVTSDQEATWLTSSQLVSPRESPDAALANLARLRACVLGASALDGPAAGDAHDEALAVTEVRPNAAWRALVRDAVERIREGELRKVVLARAVRIALRQPLDVIALLQLLRAEHRDSFVFGCWRGERAFVGASPERLVRVAGREVDASSLAGSARRGSSPAEDDALASALTESAKDRAEHAMVRAFLVEALGRLCDDVHASDTPSLLTLPNVHHLHTTVHARLRAGRSLLEVAGALHPTPAVGGTPREAALGFIEEQEHLDRGWYAAPVGWIGRDGGELAVALRSAVIAGREAALFAGCGVVAGSDPARELAESEVKLRAMRDAIQSVSGSGVRAAAEMAEPRA